MTDILSYLTFLAPPVVGAFIGYLTNRIAIRMLFRPLKKWKIGPVGLPMTPGVIPSRRHELALNIGEMVGEHLLTSEEISKALRKEEFQEHLYCLIEAKVGSFLKKELGSLRSLITPAYSHYFDIAQKTITYRIKETVSQYLASDNCRTLLLEALEKWAEGFMSRELNEVVPLAKREEFYRVFESALHRALSADQVEHAAMKVISSEISRILAEKKNLEEMLPDSLQHMILETLRGQAPLLLEKAADMVSEPEVRGEIILTVTQAVEEFIETLGPISAMAKTFLPRELIEQKVRDYLEDHSDQISVLIRSEEIEIRVAAALSERGDVMLKTPLADVLHRIDALQLEQLGMDLSKMISGFVKEKEIGRLLAGLIRTNMEQRCLNGRNSIGSIAAAMLGDHTMRSIMNWLQNEIASIVQSKRNRQVVEQSIDTLVAELVARPIGRLDHLIPSGVRTGIYQSLQGMATNMLVSEVPGIVKSINFQNIVTEKIDSFDLLRLERLLLSIMEEQFKYINLFGGLLGFLIGCVNVLVIIGLGL